MEADGIGQKIDGNGVSDILKLKCDSILEVNYVRC